MAQATWVQDGDLIDYTPAGAKSAGDVVVINGLAGIVNIDIAAGALGALSQEGVFDVVKKTGAFSSDDDVYWDPAGDPVGGTAGSGAATSNGTTNGAVYMGKCILAALSGDSTVRVRIERRRTRMPTGTVAAAGSTQSDAAQIGEGFTLVSAADATKGVKLPAAAAGKVVIVKNIDAANAILKIWPATGDVINALSANAAFSIAAKTSVMLIAYDDTTWYSLPLLPS